MRNKITKDLSRRTPGEELWLARKAAGKTSCEAAALAGVGRNAYREAELDRNPGPAPFKTGLRRVSRPSLPALLALARRRSGFGLEGLVAHVRASRVTVLAWERAGEARLVSFWEGRGFRFPAKQCVKSLYFPPGIGPSMGITGDETMQTRQATPEEIIAQFDRSIKSGEKISYRGFVRERAMRTAKNGVQHIEYFRAKLRVVNGKPVIIVKDGRGSRNDELTATMVAIPSDARGEDGSRKEVLIDLRIKSEYLK